MDKSNVFSTKKFVKNFHHVLDEKVINYLLEIIFSLPNNPAGKRRGGCIAVMHKYHLAVRPVGIIPPEKENRYYTNAVEKITRMVKNEEKRSFISRNEDLGQWGGGIQHKDVYVSFSGFLEKLDEAFSLAYAFYIQSAKYVSIPPHEAFSGLPYEVMKATQQAEFSDNEFILPVFEKFNEWINLNLERWRMPAHF